MSSLAFDPMNDFINLDLFAASPSSSSSSPLSFNSLLTPPQSSLPAFPNSFSPDPADSAFFNFNIDDEFSKLDSFTPSMNPYDFLGSTNAYSNSPDSALSASPSHTMLAIDPQLVGTPATSKASSDFDDDDEADDAEEGDAVAPAKVAGHGKMRRGTVQGGGVVKNAGKDKENSHSQKMGIVDEKPPDYQKLSSKEKRQLRNKISARNFRVRRKEYITTLEGHVAERDRLIDAIRTELGSSRSENQALRKEVAALKKALLDGRGSADTPVLPPPGPIPIRSTTPAPVSATNSNVPITNTTIVAPNPRKDLPTSPRLGARGFWGGAGIGLGGGITPVHTAIMPEWSVLGALAAKPVSASLQENINPALNGSNVANTNANGNTNGFDSFADVTPFTFKVLDPYRMQLWGKMAQQQQNQPFAQNQNHPIQPSHSSPPLTGLAKDLRPHFFSSTTRSPVLGPLLSGKGGPSYPTPPASPSSSTKSLSQSPSPPTKEQQQQAVYAAMASQTLLKKLGSAFWEAFSGSSPSTAHPGIGSNTTSRPWDAEKVRKVLEGTAVVKVVDVEPTTLPGSVGASSSSSTAGSELQEKSCAKACAVVTDILEESMRSLSIGKKA